MSSMCIYFHFNNNIIIHWLYSVYQSYLNDMLQQILSSSNLNNKETVGYVIALHASREDNTFICKTW